MPRSPGYATALPNYSGSGLGRTCPSSAGFHIVEFFFTDDSGTYLLPTRDATPLEDPPADQDGLQAWLNAALARVRRLDKHRIWLPREQPYLEGHNTWIATVDSMRPLR